jgi:hypothetical protein
MDQRAIKSFKEPTFGDHIKELQHYGDRPRIHLHATIVDSRATSAFSMRKLIVPKGIPEGLSM